MRVLSRLASRIQAVSVISLLILITSCGGGDGSVPAPTISIEVPTSDATYATTATSIRIGGRISGASFVHVKNITAGFSTEGYVNYNSQGIGSWFADIFGLVPGDNVITATADKYGDSIYTATAIITISRPLQPLTLILNAADAANATNYWVDAHSFNQSHKIALFADGTGISTTGNALTEQAGPTITFSWSILAPDAIQVINCPTCSYQKITRISGSVDDDLFLGQIETVGDDSEVALHAFLLEPGTL
jgi:hypothetical protein